jgi:hypothetical protein
MLNELSIELGAALGQERIYIAFDDSRNAQKVIITVPGY